MIYTRWWRWGWLAFEAVFSVYNFIIVGGTLGTALGGLMAFLTGHQLCYATSVCEWRNLSENWRDLYYRSRDRRISNGY